MAKTSVLQRLFRSTSVQLSLRFALLYALVSAVVFVAAYKLADYETTHWIHEQLEADAQALQQEFASNGLEGLLNGLKAYEAFNFENHRIYLLLDAKGQRLAGNVLSLPLDLEVSYADWADILFAGPNDNEAFGYVLQGFDLGGNRLILGTSTYFLLELLEGLSGGLLLGFVFLVFIGLGAGIVVGQRTERRVREVSKTLQAVASGDLAARVALGQADSDDLARLSAEINRTIGQLQKLVESQKQITADIAHDLRTPMQRLRQRLEAITQSSDLPERIGLEIDTAIAAVEELIETFHALLRISQIEAGARKESFTAVNLATVLARLEDAFSAVAEENGQTLRFIVSPAPLTIAGDQQLLTQMMANILENALRHCPSPAHIDVTLSAGQVGPVFMVSDDGPGIPQAEREKVFRRFYRLDKSRTTPGNGLGLSLVQAIADLHAAEVSLSDNAPGLRVAVLFEARA